MDPDRGSPMFKAYLLRFHRWVALAFAAPLLAVIVTGLILSFQPLLQSAYVRPGAVTLERVEKLLDEHDAKGGARSFRIDWFQNVISIDGRIDVDVDTGAIVEEDHWFSEWMAASRGLHQRLVYDMEWLVIASTAAMLVTILLGALLGLPRLANTLSGWHKGVAWGLLPLLALSPLTGLLIAAGVTFSQPAPRTQALPLREALRVIAASHDLSTVEWVRVRGGRQLARVSDGARQSTFVVTRDGLTPASANLPRTFHEGTFWGVWGGVMNVLLSLAFLALLATGVLLWFRRRLRPRRRVRGPAGQPEASLEGAKPTS